MNYFAKAVMFPFNMGLSAVGHVGKLVVGGSEVGGDFGIIVTREEYNEAVQCLKWASYAYDLKKKDAGVGEYSGWECEAGDFDTQSVVGLVDGGKTIVIGWRGTESFTDAEIDLDLVKHEDKDFKGEIHAGFLKQLHAGEAAVTKVVKRLYSENTIEKIVVTGHSLGAALATLYSVRMMNLYPNLNVRLVTFGSPRVGNKEFAEAANATLTTKTGNVHNRWAHNNDIVTRSPKVGYYHTGRFCYLGSDGVMMISDDSEADISWSRSFDDRFTAWTTTGAGSDVGDHLRDAYSHAFDACGAKCGW